MENAFETGVPQSSCQRIGGFDSPDVCPTDVDYSRGVEIVFDQVFDMVVEYAGFERLSTSVRVMEADLDIARGLR